MAQVILPLPTTAINPSPADHATEVALDATLGWELGYFRSMEALPTLSLMTFSHSLLRTVDITSSYACNDIIRRQDGVMETILTVAKITFDKTLSLTVDITGTNTTSTR